MFALFLIFENIWDYILFWKIIIIKVLFIFKGCISRCNVLKQPAVISWHQSIFNVTNLPYPWALRGEGLITSPLSLTLEPSTHGHHLPSNFSP